MVSIQKIVFLSILLSLLLVSVGYAENDSETDNASKQVDATKSLEELGSSQTSRWAASIESIIAHSGAIVRIIAGVAVIIVILAAIGAGMSSKRAKAAKKEEKK